MDTELKDKIRTKFVYVVVSNENDTYLEQAVISAASLRRHNPYALIEMVCDERTFKTFVGNREHALEYFNTITRIEVTGWNDNQSISRYLKTNLRNIIIGDFLFIDTDTIIIDDLSSIDHFQYDLGAVLDRHGGHMGEQQSFKEVLKKLKLKAPTRFKYFNSGIVYAKDTSIAKELYSKWNYRWKELKKIGINTDQPSLNSLLLNNPIVKELPAYWNYQAKPVYPVVANPKIIHYLYSSNNSDIFKNLMLSIRNSFYKKENLHSYESLILVILKEPYSNQLEWQLSAQSHFEELLPTISKNIDKFVKLVYNIFWNIFLIRKRIRSIKFYSKY